MQSLEYSNENNYPGVDVFSSNCGVMVIVVVGGLSVLDGVKLQRGIFISIYSAMVSVLMLLKAMIVSFETENL